MTEPKLSADDRAALQEWREWKREQEWLAGRKREAQEATQTRRVTDEGEGVGQIQCVNLECSECLVKQPVDLTFTEVSLFMRDDQGNVSTRVENAWTNWFQKDDSENPCPECGDPRNLLPPNAKSVWGGLRRRRGSEMRDMQALANLDIQRVEVVQREVEKANLEVQEAVSDDVRVD
jgi:hypothetical protein